MEASVSCCQRRARLLLPRARHRTALYAGTCRTACWELRPYPDSDHTRVLCRTQRWRTGTLLHSAWVGDDAKCIVVTRVCVSVCLSAAVHPHYCTDPDVTWGHGRGCPLVVHYWTYLQSGHGLHCYDNITRTLVTSLRPSPDMTT